MNVSLTSSLFRQRRHFAVLSASWSREIAVDDGSVQFWQSSFAFAAQVPEAAAASPGREGFISAVAFRLFGLLY